MRYLPDQNVKISAASQTFSTVRFAHKICQCQPNSVLTVLQISHKSVHFRMRKSRTRQLN